MKDENVGFSLEHIDDEPGMFAVVRQEQIVAGRCTFGVDSYGLICVIGLDGKLVIDPEDLDNYEHVWGAYTLAELRAAAQQTQRDDVPAPAAANVKYRTEPEGGLLRIYALRNIGHRTAKGQRGGLIADPVNLEQQGDCWIDETSKVLGNSRVRGDAYICDHSTVTDTNIEGMARVSRSTIDAYWHVTDRAQIFGSTINGGSGTVWSRARLADSTISLGSGGNVSIGGDAEVVDSLITGDVQLSGTVLEDAHLRGRDDFVSVATRFGMLTAYRGRLMSGRTADDAVVQRFAVGCQRARDFGQIRMIARRNDASQLELDLLEGFLGMVKVARGAWNLSAEPQGDDGNKPDGF